MAALLIVAVLASVAVHASAQLQPLPFQFGFPFSKDPPSSSTNSSVEAFLDFQCSDSKHMWQLLSTLSDDAKTHVHIMPFSLAYFRNSFLMLNAMYFVLSERPEEAQRIGNLLFEKQGNFSNSATQDTPPSELVTHLTYLLAEELNMTVSEVQFGLNISQGYARTATKYAYVRAIINAPTIFINGIPLYNVSEEQAFAEIKKAIGK